MTRSVLMLDGKAKLLLSSAVRDDKGSIIKASVDNGGWQLRIKDKIAYSYHYDWDLSLIHISEPTRPY